MKIVSDQTTGLALLWTYSSIRIFQKQMIWPCLSKGQIWVDTVADKFAVSFKDAAKSFGSTQILMQKQVQYNARPQCIGQILFYINASLQKVWKRIFNPKIPQVTYFMFLEISKKIFLVLRNCAHCMFVLCAVHSYRFSENSSIYYVCTQYLSAQNGESFDRFDSSLSQSSSLLYFNMSHSTNSLRFVSK